MKMILVLTTLFSISTAQASYFHKNCSNASGSVKWESGHNSNSITIEYYNDGNQSLNLPLHEVEIVHSKEVTLKKVKNNDCAVSSIASSTTVTASLVEIRPAKSSPNSLDSIANKMLKTEVICEQHMNSMMYCPGAN